MNQIIELQSLITPTAWFEKPVISNLSTAEEEEFILENINQRH
jgi:hypothetical protein